ncbi:hypothetical protein AB0F71_12895 [Kitasatospora sp. NPDC028055]|uniref:DUF6968 family protein n=1 Tax=Kitasatospora sp. NPDC028055 TaxID=3155653 RepID=UPI003407FBCB
MSTAHDIGQVIAHRELLYTAPDGTRSPVLLELGAPRRDPQGPDWSCPCRITGHPDISDRVTEIFGVDPLQALQLALARFPAELNGATGLTFLGGTDLMLGDGHRAP